MNLKLKNLILLVTAQFLMSTTFASAAFEDLITAPISGGGSAMHEFSNGFQNGANLANSMAEAQIRQQESQLRIEELRLRIREMELRRQMRQSPEF